MIIRQPSVGWGRGVRTSPAVLPDWRPPEGKFGNIPTTNTAQQSLAAIYAGVDVESVFDRWTSAVMVPDYPAPYGGYGVLGGGHGADMNIQGVVLLTLGKANGTWVHTNAPTVGHYEQTDPDPFNEFGEFAADGSPFSPHTYNALQRGFSGGISGTNPSGSIVRWAFPGSPFKQSMHSYDLSQAVNGYTRVIDDAGILGTGYGALCRDTLREGWWAATHTGETVVFIDKFGNPTPHDARLNLNGSAMSMAYLPAWDVVVMIGASLMNQPQRVYVLDCKNADQGWPSWVNVLATFGTASEPPCATGSYPDGQYLLASCGLEWSTILNCFICCDANANPGYVYRLTMTGATPFDGWRWDRELVTGHNGATLAVTGPCNPHHTKLRENVAARCFIWAPTSRVQPQAFTLQGMN